MVPEAPGLRAGASVWILEALRTTSGGPMSYLRDVPLDEREYAPFSIIKQDYGFIPNFFRAQTMRRDLLDAELHLVDAVRRPT